jgi:hypothetical protein
VKQITIPGGEATVREPGDLTPRQKRRLSDAARAAAPAIVKLMGPDPTKPDLSSAQSALEESSLSRADWERVRELQEATVCALLESWSLEQPLPTLATIGDLETDLYTALIEALGVNPVEDAETDFSPSPDADSPTNALSDSAGRSSDAPAEDSQETSSNAGEASSTESSSPA